MAKEFKEEVQQKAFKNNQAEAMLNIIYTAGWLDDIIRCNLKPFDITPEQFNVLRILKGNHPEAYALQEIRKRMLTRFSNTSRLVEKLRSKGYLTRQTMKNNRRKVEIKISKKGLNFLKEIDKVHHSSNPFQKAFSDKDAEKLSKLLDKFRSNIEAGQQKRSKKPQ